MRKYFRILVAVLCLSVVAGCCQCEAKKRKQDAEDAKTAAAEKKAADEKMKADAKDIFKLPTK